jgi:hypothetical protein
VGRRRRRGRRRGKRTLEKMCPGLMLLVCVCSVPVDVCGWRVGSENVKKGRAG